MNCPAGMGCAPVARDMNGCAVVICASGMRVICLLRKRDMRLRRVKVSQGDGSKAFSYAGEGGICEANDG